MFGLVLEMIEEIDKEVKKHGTISTLKIS